jgi:hypothetical protein
MDLLLTPTTITQHLASIEALFQANIAKVLYLIESKNSKISTKSLSSFGQCAKIDVYSIRMSIVNTEIIMLPVLNLPERLETLLRDVQECVDL